MHRNLSPSWLAGAAVLFLTVLSTLPAVAGYSSWTAQGPEGGSVSSLVIGGRQDALFAGIDDDVMKSVDGGRTWRRASQGLWQATGMLGSGPFHLAVDPTDPDTLYAGGNEGIYKTTGAGTAWNRLENDLGIRVVLKVAISPAAPRTVWVATYGGLYVSRDAGVTWVAVEGGYPVSRPGEAAIATFDVAPDPARSGIIYASGSAGLFKTSDAGAHWTRLSATGPYVLAIDPSHPWRIYAAGGNLLGVLRSADDGATWTRLANEMSAHDVRALAVDPVTSAVYAAAAPTAPQRVYRSLDGGDTWTGMGSSLPVTWPSTFAFHPRRPAVVYLGSLAGVWKSTNRGKTWASSSGGIVSTWASALAVAPSEPRVVYAGVSYAGVFKSTSRGETWGPLASLNVGPISALVVDPTTATTVFAGTDRGIFRSRDGGKTWRIVADLEQVNDLAIDPAAPFRLYAATGKGAFRSTDGGATWSPAWSPGQGLDSSVYHLAVSPGRPSDVYLTSPFGLFASSDRGETWTRIYDRVPFAVAVDPSRPSILYLSSGGGPITKSTDGGLTWTAVGSGLPPVTPLSLVIDPAHPDTLYCATWLGVFWSTDGAATWSRLGGAFDGPVLAVALDPSGPTTVHAATMETGVFELTRITPPPPGDFLTTDAFPGFRFKVLITEPGQPGVVGRQEINCIPHALCVSGKVRHRTDVLLRVDGPLPDGSFSVTVARLTRAQVDVWVERPATGDKRYYRLEAVPAGRSDTAALTGKFAFPGS